jgi:hypothetical protein
VKHPLTMPRRRRPLACRRSWRQPLRRPRDPP